MPKSNAERKREFRDRAKKGGLARVELLVPIKLVEKLRQIAKAMREGEK